MDERAPWDTEVEAPPWETAAEQPKPELSAWDKAKNVAAKVSTFAQHPVRSLGPLVGHMAEQVATLPKRALESSAYNYPEMGSGEYNPEVPTEAALTFLPLQLGKLGPTSPNPKPALPPELPRAPPEAVMPTVREGTNARLLPAETPHVELAPPAEDVLAARRSAGAASLSPLHDINPKTLDYMRQIMREQGMTPYTLEQRLEEMSPHHYLGELTPTLEADMGAVAAPPGAAKLEVVNSLTHRAREAKDRLRSVFDQYFGEAENTALLRRTMNIDQQRAAGPLYERFRQTEIPPTPQLDALVPRLRAAGAIGGARRNAAVEGRPWQTEFFTPESRFSPTAAVWDDVKRSLDKKIESSFNQFGEATSETRRITELRNALVQAIDHHPNAEVAGVWREARDTYAGPAQIKSAMKMGERLLSNSIHADELPFLIASYTEGQMAALRMGLRRHLEDKIGRAGKQELRVINEMLSENNLQKIQELIGPQETNALEQSIRHEHHLHGAKQRIVEGSPTAFRTEAQKRWTPQEGVLDKLSLKSVEEAVRHPLSTAASMLTKKAEGAVKGKRLSAKEQEFARLRDEAARIFTLQGPERDAVLRWLLETSEPSAPASIAAAPRIPPPGEPPSMRTLHARGGRINRAEGGEVSYTEDGEPYYKNVSVRARGDVSPEKDELVKPAAVPGSGAGMTAAEMIAPHITSLLRGEKAEPVQEVQGLAPQKVKSAEDPRIAGVGEDVFNLFAGPPGAKAGAIGAAKVLPAMAAMAGREAPEAVAPLMRSVLERGKSGRPIKTAPLALGSEPSILQAGLDNVKAEPLYSSLEKAISGAKQETAPAAQWLGTIKNAPGIKAEELEWTGIEPWLREQKGKVTKSQLQEYVRAHDMELKEIGKGEPNALQYSTKNVVPIGPGDDPVAASDPGRFWYFKTPDNLFQILKSKYPNQEDALQYIIDKKQPEPTANTKFQSYQLPGGTNYREMLLTMPEKPGDLPAGYRVDVHRDGSASVVDGDGNYLGKFGSEAELRDYYGRQNKDNFRSSHWDEPNILAHVRYNDRTIDGKKTLFLEEVQSDWHQAGKRKGYQQEMSPERLNEAQAIVDAKLDARYVSPRLVERGKIDPSRIEQKDISHWLQNNFITEDEASKLLSLSHDVRNVSSAVPNAPFKTSWPELSLKRMIRHAAENGYDQIAWTTGEQQAARYDLSKHIKEIEYVKYPDGSYRLGIIGKNGEGIDTPQFAYKPEELPDVVGKEVADKIIGGEGKKYRGHDGATLENLDLQIGGEGMAGFYDKMLPAAANKLAKKYGTRVELSRLGKQQEFLAEIGAKPRVDGEQVHTMKITPALRRAALLEGFPKFRYGGKVSGHIPMRALLASRS